MNGNCILLLLTLASTPVVKSVCIHDYFGLEQSLLRNPQNLENLGLAFFPTNRQASISVQVTYHFNGTKQTLHYRWSDSSVTMLIPKELLHYFSLLMYNVENRSVAITLDPLCDRENITFGTNHSQCPQHSAAGSGLVLLNQLTTNVRLY